MNDRSTIHVDQKNEDRELRHAIEIRNPSFETPEFVKLLRLNKIAAVFADTAGKWPYFEDLTADFVYLRLHGKGELYVGGYDDECLAGWANRLHKWVHGSQPKDAKTLVDTYPKARSPDAFVYFDNDVKVQAPFNAMELQRMMTGRWGFVSGELVPQILPRTHLLPRGRVRAHPEESSDPKAASRRC